MFMMMNKQTKKKREREREQTAQQEEKSETKVRDSMNSEREEQSIKPQQRDQSKRLRWHKTFNSSNIFSLSSKER